MQRLCFMCYKCTIYYATSIYLFNELMMKYDTAMQQVEYALIRHYRQINTEISKPSITHTVDTNLTFLTICSGSAPLYSYTSQSMPFRCRHAYSHTLHGKMPKSATKTKTELEY